MQRADSLEKTLMLGKTEGESRRGQQRMRCLDGITNFVDMSLVCSGYWWWTGRPGMLWSMGSWRVGHDWVTELNWTDWCHMMVFSGISGGKESTCNIGDPGSILGAGSSPEEGISYPLQCSWASLVVHMVTNQPAMQKTWVQSLNWDGPLEEGMATHSCIPFFFCFLKLILNLY